MPDQNTSDADKLRKLGKRLREGFARQYPISEKSLATVKEAVRDQWEKEREAQRDKGDDRSRQKTKERERDEPEPER